MAILLGSAGAQDLLPQYGHHVRNQKAFLKYLRPVLKARGGAGRIYYSTVCNTKDGETLPFPRVDVRAPSEGASGVAGVREIFTRDKHVTVSEDRSGIIRVTIGQPAAELLQTRIRSITFTQHEQYNPELAIAGVLNSSDVEAAMRRMGFEQPDIVLSGAIAVPEAGVPLPHLPPSMQDVTMDEALDSVARTFGGIVIYQTCAEPNGRRLISSEYVQVVDL